MATELGTEPDRKEPAAYPKPAPAAPETDVAKSMAGTPSAKEPMRAEPATAETEETSIDTSMVFD
jgi:hypothetical protein